MLDLWSYFSWAARSFPTHIQSKRFRGIAWVGARVGARVDGRGKILGLDSTVEIYYS